MTMTSEEENNCLYLYLNLLECLGRAPLEPLVCNWCQEQRNLFLLGSPRVSLFILLHVVLLSAYCFCPCCSSTMSQVQRLGPPLQDIVDLIKSLGTKQGHQCFIFRLLR